MARNFASVNTPDNIDLWRANPKTRQACHRQTLGGPLAANTGQPVPFPMVVAHHPPEYAGKNMATWHAGPSLDSRPRTARRRYRLTLCKVFRATPTLPIGAEATPSTAVAPVLKGPKISDRNALRHPDLCSPAKRRRPHLYSEATTHTNAASQDARLGIQFMPLTPSRYTG